MIYALASAFLVSTSLTGTAQAGNFLRDVAPAAGIVGAFTVLCAMTKCLGGPGAAAHQHRRNPAASAERRPARGRDVVKSSQTATKSLDVPPAPPAGGGAAPYQPPAFLPHRPEAVIPAPPESPAEPVQQARPETPPPPPPPPVGHELAIFNDRVAESRVPPIPQEIVTAALQAAYSSTTVAKTLERLPSDEGWTPDVIEAHILRRAEQLLPEFAARLIARGPANDDTLKELIARSAEDALPSALTEQEAVAFSSSLDRFMKAKAGAGSPDSAEGLPKEVTDSFSEVDAAVAKTDLGLRGKLRGRRIVLDCFAQPKLQSSAGALGATASPDADEECGNRAIAQISGPSQLEPAPAQAIWTQDGPMLNGQKWAMAQQ